MTNIQGIVVKVKPLNSFRLQLMFVSTHIWSQNTNSLVQSQTWPRYWLIPGCTKWLNNTTQRVRHFISDMSHFKRTVHSDGLVEHCSISIANAPEIPQFCPESLIYTTYQTLSKVLQKWNPDPIACNPALSCCVWLRKTVNFNDQCLSAQAGLAVHLPDKIFAWLDRPFPRMQDRLGN